MALDIPTGTSLAFGFSLVAFLMSKTTCPASLSAPAHWTRTCTEFGSARGQPGVSAAQQSRTARRSSRAARRSKRGAMIWFGHRRENLERSPVQQAMDAKGVVFKKGGWGTGWWKILLGQSGKACFGRTSTEDPTPNTQHVFVLEKESRGVPKETALELEKRRLV